MLMQMSRVLHYNLALSACVLCPVIYVMHTFV